MSAISDPLPSLVAFYYYYSFLTLLLSWLINPLLFYIILTQSKALGSFKWLIFNYTFWSLCLSTLLGAVKPLMYFPAAAGIAIGIFRDFADFKFTMACCILFIIFCVNCLTGLFATISYRYLLVFPTVLKKWFTLKKAFLFCLLFPTTAYALLVVVFVHFINIESDSFLKWARGYGIDEQHVTEKSFFVIPYEIMKYGCQIPFGLCISAYFIAIFVLAFLSIQIRKHKSKQLSQSKNYLIISSVSQIIITVTFILTPYTMLMGIILFQIPHTASFYTVMWSFLVSHCTIDSFATLYFITPYRKFILKFFKSKNRRISVVATTQQFSYHSSLQNYSNKNRYARHHKLSI